MNEQSPISEPQEAFGVAVSEDLSRGVHMYTQEELEADSAKLLEAVKHLEVSMNNLQPVPGESEFVVRSAKTPDRRLNMGDQRLAKKVLSIARERFGFEKRPPLRRKE